MPVDPDLDDLPPELRERKGPFRIEGVDPDRGEGFDAAVTRDDLAAAVRERAAAALDNDFPAVPAALRRGLQDKDAGKAARTAVAYVQLVYGRQLQQPEDEMPTDPLDVSAMTREQRNALKRRILAKHPQLVQELTGDIGESGA